MFAKADTGNASACSLGEGDWFEAVSLADGDVVLAGRSADGLALHAVTIRTRLSASTRRHDAAYRSWFSMSLMRQFPLSSAADGRSSDAIRVVDLRKRVLEW